MPIPVLALTAQAMQGDRERFLDAGFDGYVPKPVDILDLVATVRQCCDGEAASSDGDDFSRPRDEKRPPKRASRG